MPKGPNDIQYQVFGQAGIVYPGHPASIAYLVMLAYPSFATAVGRAEDATSPAALCNAAIPGSGCGVYAALDLLDHAFRFGIESALAQGDSHWRACTERGPYEPRAAAGQAQADGIKDALRAKFASWPQAQTHASAG